MDKKERSIIVLLLALVILVPSSLFVGYEFAVRAGPAIDDLTYGPGDVDAYSYAIFHDGSNYYAKNGTTRIVDYGPSTNVSDVFYDAQNSLTAGGLIKFTEGTYFITAWLWITHDNIIVEGEGRATIITQAAAQNMVHFFDSSDANGTTIRNLSIDGARATQASGTSAIHLGENSTNNVIEYNYIHDMDGHGIYLTGSTNNNKIQYNHVAFVDGNAIDLRYTSVITGRNKILYNKIEKSDFFGIGLIYADRNLIKGNTIEQDPAGANNEGINLDRSSYNIIDDNQISDTADVGIALHTGAGSSPINYMNTISNNYIAACAFDGIHLTGYTWNTLVSNNEILNNGQSGAYSGINLEGADVLYNTIIGNNALDSQGSPTQDWGIEEATSTDYNTIIGNTCRSNEVGGIKQVGANTKVNLNWNATTWIP